MAADFGGHAQHRHPHAGLRSTAVACKFWDASAAPERRVIFDINDFDETLPGPWEWDVKTSGSELCQASPVERLFRSRPA